MTLAVATMAQNNGGLSADMLNRIKSSYQENTSEKALRHALAVDDINKLATNSDNRAYDTYFSHKVLSKGITNQESSGRCWLFTGLNVMRSKMINKYHLGTFEFSHNYSFFWDQLEKSNLFLQAVIDYAGKPMDDQFVDWLFKNPLSDGGQFTGVSDVVTKYGLVPKDVMPETYSSNHTSAMAGLLKQKLREYGLALREKAAKGMKKESLVKAKEEMLGTIYGMLVRCLGAPPAKFTWTMKDASGKPVGTKEYTPLSFYQEYVGDDLKGNYVMVMNDPSRPYYRCYEIDMDRHVYDGENWRYVNLPIDEIKEMAINSIKDSTMLYFSCDVGKFLNKEKGFLDINNYDFVSLMGTTFPMDKKQRIQTFSSSSTHAMTLMAVDLDENAKPKKWMVENSWGASNGYQGHLIMTDEWFNEYMFRLVVEKKYVPAKVLDILKTKSTRLPAWDPMFASEE